MKEFKKIKNLSLNFGPQHPAAHGVLRLVLTSSTLEKKRLRTFVMYYTLITFVVTLNKESKLKNKQRLNVFISFLNNLYCYNKKKNLLLIT